MRFPSILCKTLCHLSSISDRHTFTDILPKDCALFFTEFPLFSRWRVCVFVFQKDHEETRALWKPLSFIRHSRISDITVFRVSSESKSPLTKLHCVGHIYYSWSLLSSNRIPVRQRQSDSILIGCDGGGGGCDRRESQFPERSRCNLRLKQRGGTTITDCIRSTERVIPGTGDAEIHRRVAVCTTVPTHTSVGGARISV